MPASRVTLAGITTCAKMESMKTSLDIPKEELDALLAFTGAHTKRDAILTAVRAYNDKHRREQVNRDLKGSLPDFMTVEALRELRHRS